MLREAPEFVRFINPGDLRVANDACGACHLPIVQANQKSLMANAAMFWGAASYNNGILPYKHSILGEAYTKDGQPAATDSQIKTDANMTMLTAFCQRSCHCREVGKRRRSLTSSVCSNAADAISARCFRKSACPTNRARSSTSRRTEGRPDLKQSNRGSGTGSRISIPVLNITKTRLNDPFIWMMGTNDNPGDYRSSGCSACHVVYANDRDPFHSAGYAKFGNTGTSQQIDPTIPKNESGHPLKHEFTRQIPTSQCMICHMHQPNMFINTMVGYTMWDYESDAPFMWPKQQKYPSDAEQRKILDRNPEEAAIRGKWGDFDFVKDVSLLNPQLHDTQFADYHGHGWSFRGVYARDRKGDLLDKNRQIVADNDPDKWKKAVHLQSIHVDVGMQCVDCHFAQDNHGNGYIKAEVMGAVEVQCQDCHGTVDKLPTMHVSGPSASPIGNDFLLIRNPDGKKRFEWVDGKLIQRSAVTPGLEWTMSLVETDPKSPKYNAKATRAHAAMDPSTQRWGADVPKEQRAQRGQDDLVHLPHLVDHELRQLPSAEFGRTGKPSGINTKAASRATSPPTIRRSRATTCSSSACTARSRITRSRRCARPRPLSCPRPISIVRKSTWQQPPISAAELFLRRLSRRTIRTLSARPKPRECEDCHLSRGQRQQCDHGAALHLRHQFIDFIGYTPGSANRARSVRCRSPRWDEPQAVIGSYLHRYAYPDWYKQRSGSRPEIAGCRRGPQRR